MHEITDAPAPARSSSPHPASIAGPASEAGTAESPGTAQGAGTVLGTGIAWGTGARSGHGRPRQERPRSRRWLLAGIPVAAAGLAVAVVVGFDGHSAGGPAALSLGKTPSIITVQPATAHGVVPLMDRIADAAATRPLVAAHSGQYVYVRSEVAYSAAVGQHTFDGPTALEPLHLREVWLPASGNGKGLIREDGRDETLSSSGLLNGKRAVDAGSVYNPTPAFLAALPTDPTLLLREIYTQTKGHGTDPDAEVFDTIGQMIDETLAPPAVTAALYRAAARIPGVQVVSGVSDAAGRKGIALARVYLGERDEWIFDQHSLAFLGERSYLVRATSAGPKGMLTSTTAVLAKGTADKLGKAPAAGSRT